jgi:ORF6N domain
VLQGGRPATSRLILARELAAIYGATTKRLNEQVKRNRDRFPEDFMFQLTAEEVERSRSQIATLNSGRGQNIKYRIRDCVGQVPPAGPAVSSGMLPTISLCYIRTPQM